MIEDPKDVSALNEKISMLIDFFKMNDINMGDAFYMMGRLQAICSSESGNKYETYCEMIDMMKESFSYMWAEGKG